MFVWRLYLYIIFETRLLRRIKRNKAYLIVVVENSLHQDELSLVCVRVSVCALCVVLVLYVLEMPLVLAHSTNVCLQ